MARLEPGTRAPAFSLPNQDGATVSLTELAGERVVLYFYPADDTPGCTTEACQFNDLLARFRGLSVRVLGVSPDGPASHRAFRERYGLDFDLLSDEGRTVMGKYGAYGEKTLYGKKVLGVIRSTFVIGPDGRIEHAFYGVRANGHAARVLAALR
ncbi:MAG TPA: thioredoxin-dependent thiol peroxidase [Acidimicrobiales bacterium]|nr:MAG: thioredoxin-dependent thiol peroxidase [Actinobacteria bacterium 21-73-9]HQU26035.1 thioredoxin-dependent thiol peroxidase [Acidimicrobiales bacterium]